MSDAVRDVITNAIDGLQALLARYDEVTKAIDSLVSVQASLASVKATHDKAAAELAEGQRVVEAARAKHKEEMAAMEIAVRSARAQLAALVDEAKAKQTELDGMQRQHNEVLASMQSLRTRVGAFP
jgi:chromosome segregation ATPase